MHAYVFIKYTILLYTNMFIHNNQELIEKYGREGDLNFLYNLKTQTRYKLVFLR